MICLTGVKPHNHKQNGSCFKEFDKTGMFSNDQNARRYNSSEHVCVQVVFKSEQKLGKTMKHSTMEQAQK